MNYSKELHIVTCARQCGKSQMVANWYKNCIEKGLVPTVITDGPVVTANQGKKTE